MLGWTKITGVYKAQGDEQIITIGNFNDNLTSDIVFIQKKTPTFYQAGYYIDDVSVTRINSWIIKDSIICKGDNVMLGEPNNTSGLLYNWQPSFNLSNSSSAHPTATPLAITTYGVTVSTLAGCSKQDSVTITVTDCEVAEIPNIFTPNNDGKNDELIIENLMNGSVVSIYNRWGKEVFYSNNTSRLCLAW